MATSIATGLGIRLRQARNWADLTQQETANVLDVPREVISYWENDRRVPSLAQLGRLAELYGSSIGSLAGLEAESPFAEDREFFDRALRSQEPRTKLAVRRWLAFLDDWADLLAESGEDLPGPSAPPVRAWRSAVATTHSRRAAALALDVRAHYGFGSDAIPDLRALLDRLGVLVYRAALAPLDHERGVSGASVNHPKLGACILVNANTTPGRQLFTLAHELAHVLFHYQERGLVCRAGDADRKERFADAFAAHLLVPGDRLRELIAQMPHGRIVDPLDIVPLQRSFRVSYATMLNRLLVEDCLSLAQYEHYRTYSPRSLAAMLGLAADGEPPTGEPSGVFLDGYPPTVLSRVRAMVEYGELTPAGAADLLQVAQEAILDELLAEPAPASDAEAREFAELPAPSPRRSRTDG